MKTTFTYSVLAVLILLGIVATLLVIRTHRREPAIIHNAVQQYTYTPLPMKTITLGSTTVEVEVANTDAEREQGLSDRVSLDEGKGMLFIFPTPVVPGFWMKDMHFSLDMVWIDKTGKVVDLSENIAPSTYPQAFRPSKPVLYVLEVPAGFVARHGIAKGMKMMVL